MRSLGIVRRLVGCFYCGQPCGYRENRGDVCWQCADLPSKDPFVSKVRQPLSEAELMAAARERNAGGAAPASAWVAAVELYQRGVDTPFSRWMASEAERIEAQG